LLQLCLRLGEARAQAVNSYERVRFTDIAADRFLHGINEANEFTFVGDIHWIAIRRKSNRRECPQCVIAEQSPCAPAMFVIEVNGQSHLGKLPQPCGFFGGGLFNSSGHSLSTTARISSEMAYSWG
jgi:hypothetical protein